jgi:hypothetical protein
MMSITSTKSVCYSFSCVTIFFAHCVFILQDKKTALHWAVEKGHKDVASLLVERGADIEAKDRVRTYTKIDAVSFHIVDY